MKNVIVRSITGLIYIGAIVGAICAGTDWFAFLLALFLIPSVYELSRMTGDSPVTNRGTVMLDVLIGELIVLTGMVNDTSVSIIVPMIMLAVAARFVMQLYLPHLRPVDSLGHSVLSWLYVAAPLSLLGWLYTVNPWIVLGMFVMIWLNDTGAFCVGSLIGRHRLFERVSPKKSWEGFIGGIVFCTGAGAVYHYCFGDSFHVYGIPLSLTALLVMGAIVGIAGTFGDLIESVFKRSCGIKDSGKLLPGHGGMLDRIDSLLLVAPAVAAYLMMFHL